MEELRLFDAEYRFMELIWDMEPVRSMDLAKKAFQELGWKKSTCYTVLKKLVERGFVENDHAVVQALIAREQVQRYESQVLLDKSFGGSLPAFLTLFLKDRKLSKKEAEEIKKMIEEADE